MGWLSPTIDAGHLPCRDDAVGVCLPISDTSRCCQRRVQVPYGRPSVTCRQRRAPERSHRSPGRSASESPSPSDRYRQRRTRAANLLASPLPGMTRSERSPSVTPNRTVPAWPPRRGLQPPPEHPSGCTRHPVTGRAPTVSPGSSVSGPGSAAGFLLDRAAFPRRQDDPVAGSHQPSQVIHLTILDLWVNLDMARKWTKSREDHGLQMADGVIGAATHGSGLGASPGRHYQNGPDTWLRYH